MASFSVTTYECLPLTVFVQTHNTPNQEVVVSHCYECLPCTSTVNLNEDILLPHEEAPLQPQSYRCQRNSSFWIWLCTGRRRRKKGKNISRQIFRSVHGLLGLEFIPISPKFSGVVN